MKSSVKVIMVIALGVVLAGIWQGRTGAQTTAPDGAKLYEQRCAVCHDNPQDRIPPKSVLARRSADEVIAALTTGSMKTQASGLKEAEIRALAVYVTGKQPSGPVDPAQLANRCQAPAGPINLKAPAFGWLGERSR